MNKSERLLQLLTLLRGRRSAITALELAHRLNVSERTIYRDIQSLVLSGVDIQGEAGIGYLLQPGNSVPPLMFTENEIEALMLGIRIVKSWMDDDLGQEANNALDKIKAALPSKLLHNLENRTTKFLVPDYCKQDRTRFSDLIRVAIEQKTAISLHYISAEDNTSERNVFPLGLVFWGATWTLAAWCTLRKDYRSFRLDRILDCHVIELPTPEEENFSLQGYLNHYDENASVGFWDG